MSKFLYPRLPRREIIEVLAKSNIAAVSESDLLHPDPDFICNLYARVISHILPSKADPGRIEFGAMVLLENPDSHSHSVPVMKLFNEIRQLLAFLRCPKAFTPKDLINPETERTEIFLSALLNFHLFRLTKSEMLKPYVDELDILEGRGEVAEKRIEELKAVIDECEESGEKEMPLVQELSSKVMELHETVSKLNKSQMDLKTQIKVGKDKNKEMDDKTSDAEFALAQSVQENAILRSKIVQSPDKLKSKLEEKKLVQAEALIAERAAQQSVQDKTATLEAYVKGSKKLSKHLSQMQALEEQMNSTKTVDKKLKFIKSKLSDDGVEIKSLDAKLVELQSKADQKKESKKQLEKKKALIHEEVDKELKNCKSQVNTKRRALETRQRQVESVVAEGNALVSKRKSVEEKAEAKMQEMNLKSNEIVDKLENYMKEINSLLPVTDVDQQVVQETS